MTENWVPVAVEHEIDLPKVNYKFGVDGLTYITFKSYQHIHIEDSLEELEALKKFPERLPITAIVRIEPFAVVSAESGEFFLKGVASECIKAEAVLISSLADEISLQPIRKMADKKMNVKTFKKLENARKWASQFLKS